MKVSDLFYSIFIGGYTDAHKLLLAFACFSQSMLQNKVGEYLKPYLDACRATFKAKHYYYFGIHLLIRPIVFVIGNGILDTEKTLVFSGSYGDIDLLIPFKNSTTELLCIEFRMSGDLVLIFQSNYHHRGLWYHIRDTNCHCF